MGDLAGCRWEGCARAALTGAGASGSWWVAAGVQAGPTTGGDVACVAEGLWAGLRCSAWSGDEGAWPAALGCPWPRYGVPLSTCAWPPAPATAGGLHRCVSGLGNPAAGQVNRLQLG